jgi:hypothetical protein
MGTAQEETERLLESRQKEDRGPQEETIGQLRVALAHIEETAVFSASREGDKASKDGFRAIARIASGALKYTN